MIGKSVPMMIAFLINFLSWFKISFASGNAKKDIVENNITPKGRKILFISNVYKLLRSILLKKIKKIRKRSARAIEIPNFSIFVSEDIPLTKNKDIITPNPTPISTLLSKFPKTIKLKLSPTPNM